MKKEEMKICLHLKHRTPESRWNEVYKTSMPPSLPTLLRQRNMIAEKCIDCGKDISNLDLLKP